MITRCERQSKRESEITPIFSFDTAQINEISHSRLCQFLEETLGEASWCAAGHTWVDAVPTTRDHRFVVGLSQAFRGIPLGTSAPVHVSFNADEPRLFKV